MKSIVLSSQHKSLRQWMTNPLKTAQLSAHTDSDEELGMKKEQEQQQQQQLPERLDILILDGGVSTHLEELHKQHSSTSSTSSTSSSCSTKAFQHRELWSSSLLLDQKGQHDIQTSHETFYNSGCNIISTVTYQLSHHLCKEVTKTSSNTNSNTNNNNKNNTNSTEHDDNIDNDEEASENNEKIILTEYDVDTLLRLGVRLAHETRIKKMEEIHKQQQNQKQKQESLSTSISISPPLYVVASLGCYGAALADGSEYRGNYDISLQELIIFHKRRFNVMMDLNNSSSSSTTTTRTVGSGTVVSTSESNENRANRVNKVNENHIQVDGIAFETVPNALEIEAIIQVVKERKKKPKHGGSHTDNDDDDDDDDVAIWISLACKDDKYLNDGTPLTEVLDTIDELDDDGYINGIGVNCFNIKYATSLTKVIAEHQLKSKTNANTNGNANANANRAIIFYPNSGEEWDAVNESWLEGSGISNPHHFATHMMDAIKSIHSILGDKQHCRIIVGGCCRTSPATIQSLRKHVDEYLGKISN